MKKMPSSVLDWVARALPPKPINATVTLQSLVLQYFLH